MAKVTDETTIKMLKWLEVIPMIPKDIRGIEHKAPCTCGGTVTAIRSIYNGHLHASCDKCGARLME